jgi:ABC-type uncharacterized transport system YnjBCD substrate-binding protein
MIRKKARLWRLAAGVGLLALLAAAGPAPDNAPPLDPNWPCQQIRIDHMALATMWGGPPLGKYLDDWQQNVEAATLARQLAQRRVPIAQAQAEITAFAKAAGNDKQAALLALVGGLFSLLDQERFAVIQGLDRFGARQKSYAADIRAEITALHNAQDAAKPDPQNVQKLSEQIHWDTRVFADRNSMISYACFVPDEIEHRLFALVGTASNLLP